MKVTIKVTADHIAQGQPGEPSSCPIALACKDAGLFDPSIAGTGCNYVKDAGGVRYGFNEPAIDRFIDLFDKEEPAPNQDDTKEMIHVGRELVSPFEFEAELTEYSRY